MAKTKKYSKKVAKANAGMSSSTRSIHLAPKYLYGAVDKTKRGQELLARVAKLEKNLRTFNLEHKKQTMAKLIFLISL